MGLKIIMIGIGCVFLLTGLGFLYVSLCFSKKHTAKTKGFLARGMKHSKNVSVGRFGKLYPHWVDYAYQYTLNGKTYQIECSHPGKPDEVRSTVTIIYQKKHPQLSYVPGLTLPWQPFASGASLIIGMVFLLCGAL